jgi:hypothetical protein
VGAAAEDALGSVNCNRSGSYGSDQQVPKVFFPVRVSIQLHPTFSSCRLCALCGRSVVPWVTVLKHCPFSRRLREVEDSGTENYARLSDSCTDVPPARCFCFYARSSRKISLWDHQN